MVLAAGIILILILLFTSTSPSTPAVKLYPTESRRFREDVTILEYRTKNENPNGNNINEIETKQSGGGIERKDLKNSYAKLANLLERIWEYEYECPKIKSLPENANGDGVWTFCNKEVPQPPCYAYSFGIAGDFRFEDAYHAFTQCEVFAFDPSMMVADHKHADGVMFYNRGISHEKNDRYPGVEYGGNRKPQTWKVNTVLGYMNEFNHTHLSLLKVDAEGAEWDALTRAVNDGVLQRVDQMLFEIHFWGYNQQNLNEHIQKWYNLFNGIENEGFRLFFSHVNPHSARQDLFNNFYFPCCYELGFARIAKPTKGYNSPFTKRLLEILEEDKNEKNDQ